MTLQHANTLAVTIISGMALRYVAMEGAKLIPGPGWIVASALAAAGTWAIGQVAIQYFDHGKKMNKQQLQDLYRKRLQVRRNPRPPVE